MTPSLKVSLRFLVRFPARAAFGVAAAVAALTASAFAQTPPVNGSSPPPTPAAIPLVETAPRIDGDLTDAVWSNALRAGDFARFGTASAVDEATDAWMCTDGRTLFVAFHCHDSQPARIRTSETQRGSVAVYDDDNVNVIVDSQNTRREFSQFYVNARGTQYDVIEGGTAQNITWVGDWRAATRRVADGWTCEIAIPWRLLRYPRGASTVGLLLRRRVARETNPMSWPAVPAQAQTMATLAPFLPAFLVPTLPSNGPRPVILPYVLGQAGRGASGRTGVDVKYPFSTTLTGLLTIKPDFLTIENDVADVNFSYNEQQVADRRPFFADGNLFLPDTDLFYSRRIDQVDEGVKLIGRTGARSIGFLASNHDNAEDGRTSAALRIEQGVGRLSRYGLSAVADNQIGAPGSRTLRAYGEQGWQIGKRRYYVLGKFAPSFEDAHEKGTASEVTVRTFGVLGQPSIRLTLERVPDDWISNLGLVQNRNRIGGTLRVAQSNRFDKGKIEKYDTECSAGSYDRAQGGGFFRNFLNLGGFIEGRNGNGVSLIDNRENRRQLAAGPTFADHTTRIGLSWNQRTLFSGGAATYLWGRQAGEPIHTIGLEQGVQVNRQFSVHAVHFTQKQGDVTTRQTIVTGTWRLDSERTISGRLVSQNGTGNTQNVGPQRGTNLYFAFAQRVRRGTDIYVLLGDPNADDTRSVVTVKLLRPF